MTDRDQSERAMRDDDGVEIGVRHVGHELLAPRGMEPALVGHGDPGGRVLLVEFLGELAQHVVRHHVHRLANEAETAHFHAGADHSRGLPGTDGVGHVGVAVLDDARHHAALVRSPVPGRRHPGRRQVVAVELARDQVVVLGIIEIGVNRSARWVFPEPIAEPISDLLHLGGSRLGRRRIENLLPVNRVVTGHARGLAVEGGGNQLRRRHVDGAPGSHRGCRTIVAAHRPKRQLRGIADGQTFEPKRLGGEEFDGLGRYPRHPEVDLDLGGAQRRRLGRFEGVGVALESIVASGSFLRLAQLLAHVARQVLVPSDPGILRARD